MAADNTAYDCYAARLGGCAGGMTAEHYFSDCILRRIRAKAPGGVVRVEGFPWCESPKHIGPSALRARVLCKRHNDLLSPLDDAGCAFFDALDLALPSNYVSGDPAVVKINARHLERWVIKVLCGVLASGNMPAVSGIPKMTPPLRLIEVLYGLRELPRNLGLYWCFRLGDVLSREPVTRFSPIVDGNQIVGACLKLSGCDLYLVLVKQSSCTAGTFPDNLLRVGNMDFMDRQRKALRVRVHFDWPSSGDVPQVAKLGGSGGGPEPAR